MAGPGSVKPVAPGTGLAVLRVQLSAAVGFAGPGCGHGEERMVLRASRGSARDRTSPTLSRGKWRKQSSWGLWENGAVMEEEGDMWWEAMGRTEGTERGS